MEAAISKEQLIEKTSLSMSTIDRLEKLGEFPKRFYITDRRAVWNADEVEAWLDVRQIKSPVFTGKKPPVEKRKYRRTGAAAGIAA
ncbi:AlpA family transcriptional regulator [Enterobacter roggenkampii]|uniref:helix-turn-helix transcriptional regulator n=1 Tax=Enterobacterales TaxID=91347 RepID=UPI00201FFDD6|nr:AlpA family phage regulatory protein [Enterobacter roggenkampii]MCL8154079.1 AlpA family transcriptional regulator [Enterobacter roggenkampii]MCM7558183.1 AlpA family transcriptional regulator [Enterobacter roggenkampii]MDH0554314.1 AlpA family transcriptional regulator [Enterobacter roggenkampii]